MFRFTKKYNLKMNKIIILKNYKIKLNWVTIIIMGAEKLKVIVHLKKEVESYAESEKGNKYNIL